ncbi:hypothetical protein Zmor_026738 [Zophobas morio]|uniref:Uncharacterized protein n=1 Tax=Zophobas morio TaxID=2755281 RepID=A0AA38HU98_9CUCU|nr:hypothetical protein Zmor_026738 [Zophobas morio]
MFGLPKTPQQCVSDKTFGEINSQPPKDKINTVTYRSFKYFDTNEFSRDASLINWNHIINLESIDKLSFFNSAIIALFDVHAPLKTTTTKRPAKPYITDNKGNNQTQRQSKEKVYSI